MGAARELPMQFLTTRVRLCSSSRIANLFSRGLLGFRHLFLYLCSLHFMLPYKIPIMPPQLAQDESKPNLSPNQNHILTSTAITTSPLTVQEKALPEGKPWTFPYLPRGYRVWFQWSLESHAALTTDVSINWPLIYASTWNQPIRRRN